MTAHVINSGLKSTADLLREIVATDNGSGSAFSVRRHGELVFSMSIGVRNESGDEMTRDTLMPIFSGTKGLLAGVIATLVDRGLVKYEEKLSTYWPSALRWQDPELTVALCLSHRAGLPHIDPPTQGRELWDTDLMLERLAQTEQLFQAGSRMAYHWLTYGWFTESIIRCVTKVSTGETLRRLVTSPFGIDAYLGIPTTQLLRCGAVVRSSDYLTNVFADPNPFIDRVYGNPKLLDGKELLWNEPELMQKELPGCGAWASADGMSKFYGTLLATDTPSALLSKSGLTAAWTPRFEGVDAVTNRPMVMAMGFERDDSIGSYGPIVPAFGHTGAGGSIHGCWPETGISFSYLPRMMRTDQQDQRGKSLLKSIVTALL